MKREEDQDVEEILESIITRLLEHDMLCETNRARAQEIEALGKNPALQYSGHLKLYLKLHQSQFSL